MVLVNGNLNDLHIDQVISKYFSADLVLTFISFTTLRFERRAAERKDRQKKCSKVTVTMISE